MGCGGSVTSDGRAWSAEFLERPRYAHQVRGGGPLRECVPAAWCGQSCLPRYCHAAAASYRIPTWWLTRSFPNQVTFRNRRSGLTHLIQSGQCIRNGRNGAVVIAAKGAACAPAQDPLLTASHISMMLQPAQAWSLVPPIIPAQASYLSSSKASVHSIFSSAGLITNKPFQVLNTFLEIRLLFHILYFTQQLAAQVIPNRFQ